MSLLEDFLAQIRRPKKPAAPLDTIGLRQGLDEMGDTAQAIREQSKVVERDMLSPSPDVQAMLDRNAAPKRPIDFLAAVSDNPVTNAFKRFGEWHPLKPLFDKASQAISDPSHYQMTEEEADRERQKIADTTFIDDVLAGGSGNVPMPAPSTQQLIEGRATKLGALAGLTEGVGEQTKPSNVAMLAGGPLSNSTRLARVAPKIADAAILANDLYQVPIAIESANAAAQSVMPAPDDTRTWEQRAKDFLFALPGVALPLAHLGGRAARGETQLPNRQWFQGQADQNSLLRRDTVPPKPKDFAPMAWDPELNQPMPPAAGAFLAKKTAPQREAAAKEAAHAAEKARGERTAQFVNAEQQAIPTTEAELAALEKAQNEAIAKVDELVAKGDPESLAEAERIAAEVQSRGFVYEAPTARGKTMAEGVQEPLRPAPGGGIENPNLPEYQAWVDGVLRDKSELESFLQANEKPAPEPPPAPAPTPAPAATQAPVEAPEPAADPYAPRRRTYGDEQPGLVNQTDTTIRGKGGRKIGTQGVLRETPEPPQTLEAMLGRDIPDIEVVGETPTRANGSGESSASVEAINRDSSMKSQGKQFGIVDRSGNFRPLIGPDAVDARPGRGEAKVIRDADGNYELVEGDSSVLRRPAPVAQEPPATPPAQATPPAAPPEPAQAPKPPAPVQTQPAARPAVVPDPARTVTAENGQTAQDPSAVLVSDPSRIGIDAKTYQFKESEPGTGVTGALAGVSKWDENSPPILLHERADGSLWVADGHQRLNKYRELQAQGQKLPPLRARVLREADGFDTASVRRMASLRNVQEGSASTLDIAKLLRDGPITPDERARIPQASTTGARLRAGESLSKLSPEAFQAVLNGEAVPEAVASVPKYFTDPAEQLAAVRSIGKRGITNALDGDAYVRSLRDGMLTRKEQGAQGVLFEGDGFEDIADLRAKLMRSTEKLLKSRRAAFSGALRNKAALEGAGNILVEGVNAEQRTEAQKLLGYFQKYADQAGTATNAALRQLTGDIYAKRISSDAAADQLLDAVRRDIETGGATPTEIQPSARVGGDGPLAGGEPGPASKPGPEPEVKAQSLDELFPGPKPEKPVNQEPTPLADMPFDLTRDRALPENAPPPTKAELESLGQSDMFAEPPAPPKPKARPVSLDEMLKGEAEPTDVMEGPGDIRQGMAQKPKSELEALIDKNRVDLTDEQRQVREAVKPAEAVKNSQKKSTPGIVADADGKTFTLPPDPDTVKGAPATQYVVRPDGKVDVYEQYKNGNRKFIRTREGQDRWVPPEVREAASGTKRRYMDATPEEREAINKARSAALDAAAKRGVDMERSIFSADGAAKDAYAEGGVDAAVKYWNDQQARMESLPANDRKGWTDWQKRDKGDFVAPEGKGFVSVRFNTAPDAATREIMQRGGWRYDPKRKQWFGNVEGEGNRKGRPRQELLDEAEAVLGGAKPKAEEAPAPVEVPKANEEIESVEQQRAALDEAQKQAEQEAPNAVEEQGAAGVGTQRNGQEGTRPVAGEGIRPSDEGAAGRVQEAAGEEGSGRPAGPEDRGVVSEGKGKEVAPYEPIGEKAAALRPEAPPPIEKPQSLEEMTRKTTVEQLPPNVKSFLRKRVGLSDEDINAMTVDEAVARGKAFGEEARAKKEQAQKEPETAPEKTPLEDALDDTPLEPKVKQWAKFLDRAFSGEEPPKNIGARFGAFISDLLERQRRRIEILRGLNKRPIPKGSGDQGALSKNLESRMNLPKYDEATAREAADLMSAVDDFTRFTEQGRTNNRFAWFPAEDRFFDYQGSEVIANPVEGGIAIIHRGTNKEITRMSLEEFRSKEGNEFRGDAPGRFETNESFGGVEIRPSQEERFRQVRERDAMLEKGTPDALDRYAQLMGEMQDREHAIIARNKFSEDKAQMPPRSESGEYIGSLGGGFQKLRDIYQKDPEQFWHLMRMAGAPVGGAIGALTDDEDRMRGFLRGAITGMTLSYANRAGARQLAKYGRAAAVYAKAIVPKVEGFDYKGADIRRTTKLEKDMPRWKVVAPGSPEHTLPETWKKATDILHELNVRKAYGDLKTAGPAVTKLREAQAIKRAVAGIREDAAAYEKKGFKRAAAYANEMADALAKRPTKGQIAMKGFAKLFGADPNFDWVERHVGTNAYRVLTGFAVDTALQNLTQPILALRHVSIGDLLWAYRHAGSQWAKDMTRHVDIHRPTDMSEDIGGVFEVNPEKLSGWKGAVLDSQRLIAKSDKWNRRVVYLAAMRQANSRGLMGAYAKEWARAVNEQTFTEVYHSRGDEFARSVMRDTQGDVGPLSFNPNLRGPIGGTLRPFTKFPALFVRNMADILTQPDKRGASRFVLTMMAAVWAGHKMGLDLEETLLMGGRPFGVDLSDPKKALDRVITGDMFPVVRAGKDLYKHYTGDANHPLIGSDLEDMLLNGDVAYYAMGRYPQKVLNVAARTMRSGIDEPHMVRTPSGAANPMSALEDWIQLSGFKASRPNQLSKATSEAADVAFKEDSARKASLKDLNRQLRLAQDRGDREMMASVQQQMANLTRDPKYVENAMKHINDTRWQKIYNSASPKVKALLMQEYGDQIRELQPPR